MLISRNDGKTGEIVKGKNRPKIQANFDRFCFVKNAQNKRGERPLNAGGLGK